MYFESYFQSWHLQNSEVNVGSVIANRRRSAYMLMSLASTRISEVVLNRI